LAYVILTTGGGGGSITVTMALTVLTPVTLLARSVYVVVAPGETICDPLAATAAPFNVIDVASADVQDNIADWPVSIVAGVTVNMAVGIGTGAVTVTVALTVLTPVALVARSVYIVVAAGETTCDPLAATVAPFNVTDAASVDVHDNVVDWPVRIEAGAAVSVAVGIGTGAVTVTVALTVFSPAAFVARSVYISVAVGETVCDPLAATVAPFNVTDAASVDVHANVDD
jgi:hypothetical protein